MKVWRCAAHEEAQLVKADRKPKGLCSDSTGGNDFLCRWLLVSNDAPPGLIENLNALLRKP